MKYCIYYLIYFFTSFVSAQDIYTIAGGSTQGFYGDGGPAISALLDYPFDMAFDGNGNLYIADRDNNRIRMIAGYTGIITTVVGNGTPYYTGDNGLATEATLNGPTGIAIDANSNLYIADQGNSVIRKVDAVTGIISTIAGDGIYGLSGDGGPATSAHLTYPVSVAVDNNGNIYFTDGDRVRKVAAGTGIISTIAGRDTAGFSGDGGTAVSAELNLPTGVTIDNSGNLYIVDSGNRRVRKVTASTGIINTVVGSGNNFDDGIPATQAALSSPVTVAIDAAGNLYITDDDGKVRVRKVDASTGIITTIAGNGTRGYNGDSILAAVAELAGPIGLAINNTGNVFISDYSIDFGCRIRMITDINTAILSNSPDSLRVYPNPNTGFFTVQFSDNQLQYVSLFDITGRCIVSALPVTSYKDFDISGLCIGAYLLQVTDAGNTSSYKLIKQD